MRFKRLLYYLLINVLVSACTVLVILYAWETYRPLDTGTEPAPIVLAPTATPEYGIIAATVEPGQGTESEPQSEGNPEFITYTVLPGDTLSGIAFQFDVSVEAILAANALDNPDSLGVNDVILIPINGAVANTELPPELAASNTPLPPPTIASTGSPVNAGDPMLQIVIVIGTGELSEERVVIRQEGDAQVSLQGWQIIAPDGETFTFPQLVLFKDGAVTVYTKAGGNTVAELYWGSDVAIWQSGDVVTLVDPKGNIAAAYQVP